MTALLGLDVESEMHGLLFPRDSSAVSLETGVYLHLFTGIIETIGRIAAVRRHGAAATLTIQTPCIATAAAIGDSIAVNGACLTVTTLDGDTFSADAVEETLRRTNLGALTPGDRVNLERSVTAQSLLQGHIVQGHIDGTGVVSRIVPEASSQLVTIDLPTDLAPFVVAKGSIAVDGVSLTVVNCTETSFQVALIPHTQTVTTLDDLYVGRRVNIEVDILAKYVARLLQGVVPSAGALTEARMRDLGY